MGHGKWKGNAGLVATDTALLSADPVITPHCEDATLTGTPVLDEQENTHGPDIIEILEYGKEYTWGMSNITPTAEEFGYLMWCFLGADTFLTGTHTIIPDPDCPYICYSRDIVAPPSGIGTDTTERLVGSIISALDFEVAMKKFMTMNVSGPGCDKDTPEAALTLVTVAGDPGRALAWKHLQDANGYFKIGYASEAAVQDGFVTGLKFNATRAANAESGITLASNQPTGVEKGKREVTVEITREWDTNAAEGYAAWEAGDEIALDIMFYVSALVSVRMQIPHMQITGPYVEGVGKGEEVVTATLSAKAKLDPAGVDPLMTVTVMDGNSIAVFEPAATP